MTIARVKYIGDDSETHHGDLVAFVYRPDYVDVARGHRGAKCVGIVARHSGFVEVPREALEIVELTT